MSQINPDNIYIKLTEEEKKELDLVAKRTRMSIDSVSAVFKEKPCHSERCPICRSDLYNGTPVIELNCGHMHHKACREKYFSQDREKCIECNKDVGVKRVIEDGKPPA